MVDLDSNPTKLIEVVEIGKQLLMTRGALTTFSIANDVAKYFAIIPAAFATTYPALERAQHHAPGHAGERDPVARSSSTRSSSSRSSRSRCAASSTAPSARRGCLRDNLLVYGVGGIVVAVRRHQADRHAPRRPPPRLKEESSMLAQLRAAARLARRCSRSSPASPTRSLVTGIAQAAFPRQANGSLDREGRQGRRLDAHRPAVRRPEVLLGPPLGDADATAGRYNGAASSRLEPRPDQPGARRRR